MGGPEIGSGVNGELTTSDRERMAFNAGPGPPIQMSANDQGPDGANLFVFHIPNWCSNRQLYDLFTPHGSVISCRIFVDKISGRSRGFGFVSYDMPQAAQSAIEQMNGYELGHKRLKVEIKRSKRGGQRNDGGQRDGGQRDGGQRNDGYNGGQQNGGYNNSSSSSDQYSNRTEHGRPMPRGPYDSNRSPHYMQPVDNTPGILAPTMLTEEGGDSATASTLDTDTNRPMMPQLSSERNTSERNTDSATSTPTISSDLSLRLWKAAGQGNLRLVSELFTDGARLNWQHPGRDGQTAIHHACQFDQQAVTEWLIAHGVDIHSTDHEGNTSLHIASMYGHAGLLRYLIAANGGKIDIKNDDGQLPMDLARVYKKERTLRLLETLETEKS